MFIYKFISRQDTEISAVHDAMAVISTLSSYEKDNVCLFEEDDFDDPFDYLDKMVSGSKTYLLLTDVTIKKFDEFLRNNEAVQLNEFPKLKNIQFIAGNPNMISKLSEN